MGSDPLCGRDKLDEDCLRPIFLCQGSVLGSVPVVAIRRHVPVYEPFPIAFEKVRPFLVVPVDVLPKGL